MGRLAVASIVALLWGCASGGHPHTLVPEPGTSISRIPRDTFTVDASYGTLSFQGMIERVDRGNEYEYRPHIDVTFHPDRPVNRVPVADLVGYRLVATVPPNDSGPWQLLHEETHPIIIRLTRAGETAHLPETSFHLSKTIAARARRVGMGVLDGHLLWPIPVNLQ